MLTELFTWLAQGRLKPHVSRSYPLADTPSALEALLARKAVGKLVIVPHA
jgi:NADPH2:quinone reductase